jgi:predicted kinase
METVIFTGIQGSGKTTFYKEKFFTTHVRISLDLLATRNREWRFLTTCFETGTPFVVDNTNINTKQRFRYIEPAIQNKFRLIGYFFDCKLEDSLIRNSLRTGKDKIPDGGVIATYRKLVAPKIEEGFDELYKVTIGEESSFTVEMVGKQCN